MFSQVDSEETHHALESKHQNRPFRPLVEQGPPDWTKAVRPIADFQGTPHAYARRHTATLVRSTGLALCGNKQLRIGLRGSSPLPGFVTPIRGLILVGYSKADADVIEKEEINSKSEELGVHVSNVKMTIRVMKHTA